MFYNILQFRLIYQSKDPVPTIILEDVSAKGFGVEYKTSEDFEVSKQVARRLAKFHAGFVILCRIINSVFY